MAQELVRASLTAGDVSAVASFCNTQGLSPTTFYLSAWCYTLSIYSAVSAVTTNLARPDGEDGHARVSPVSATIGGHMTVLEACSALHIAGERLHLERSSAGGYDLHNGGTTVTFLKAGAPESRPELMGMIQANVVIDDDCNIILHYLPDSIPALSPQAFLETFTTIVTIFATSPHNTLLRDLDILGPINRTTLATWAPSHIAAVERCIHDFVDEHAQKNPEKDAVVATEGPNFTYAQLSVLSSNLAAHLLQLGIQKGDIVPILFDKSSVAVLAIVAILKAGAAYVGFSAETPVNFLRECSAIANVPLIITSRQHQPLVDNIGRRALVLDQDLLATLQTPASGIAFTSPAQPSDLAYLVFTSGSTGVPKAVMTEHRAYVTDAVAQLPAALLSSDSRVLHFASYNFDATNFDVLSTLIAGGTICVPTEHTRLNNLAGAINDLGANFLGVTATLAQILDPADVPCLKVVILCGEANSPETVARWTTAAAAAGADVVNGYGPSEASCAFSYNVYTRQNPQANNVGRALDGACWGWVVSPENHEQLVPVGARGELMIQGPTLSRGYLNEPGKTADVFVEGPAWLPERTAGGMRRLYKTGDLVRQLADQSYEVYGRIDTQVKINGQRIELGEIEHKISRVLGDGYTIAVEAISLSTQIQGNPKILAAFYAPDVGTYPKDAPVLDLVQGSESAAIDVKDTKEKLTDDLKAIAIPQAFIPLRVMPVTIQGKLDRKTLQVLGSQLNGDALAKFSGIVTSSHGEPVRSGLERTVQELFAKVLNLSKDLIYRDSDFFAAGGDSIKGIKLVSLARKLGLNLSVPDILQTPRLSCLAELLERSKVRRDAASEYRPFDAILDQKDANELRAKAAGHSSGVDDIEDIIQATDLQASCVAFSTYSEERRGINWLLCDFATPHTEETVRRMCETLTARHATLRTFFIPHQRSLYQVISKSFQPPLSIHLNLPNMHDTTTSLMETDLRTRAVDMTHPQTAFTLLSRTDASRIERLVIRISAAQYDGHSVTILGREMTTLLGGRPLDELRGSYPAYLHHARATERDQGTEYWRHLLAGAEMPELTRRKSSAPPGLDFVDGVLTSMIDTRLLEPSSSGREPAAGATRATIVKTAWALTLASLTGREDVVFGSTGWGRNHAVGFAQDVMGSCTSHIPTRARLEKGDSYRDLVARLQTQHVASMRFENMGANTVVKGCTSWRRWTRFSSLLVFQGLDIETPQGSDEEEEEKEEEASSLGVRFTEIMDPGDRTDVIVHVEPFGEQTRVMVAFSRKNVSEEVAGVMLETFERYLELVTQSSDKPIELGARGSPLLPVVSESAEVEEAAGGVVHARAKDIVKDTWAYVLAVGGHEVDKLEEEGGTFLGVWGNTVSAAALAHEYREKGFAVSTENVLRHQTVRGQVAMISSMLDFQNHESL